MEKVISNTKQTMVAYMSEEDLNRLCTYVAEYSTDDTLQKVSPVKVDSQLKSIDIMHFGWNIGKAFGRKRIHTATLIKNVFAHTLLDLEISTIERKMSHTESEYKIKLNKEFVWLNKFSKIKSIFMYSMTCYETICLYNLYVDISSTNFTIYDGCFRINADIALFSVALISSHLKNSIVSFPS